MNRKKIEKEYEKILGPKEKEENIVNLEKKKNDDRFRRKYFENKIFGRGMRRERGKYLEEENILNLEEKKNGVGLGGNYLENEKALAAEEKKNRGGKEGNYLEKEK